MTDKIYLPIDNINSYQCYSVLNKDTIRAYVTQPRVNSSSTYVDYYITSHYLSSNGSQTWGNTSNLPICVNNSRITNNLFYRTDISDSLVIFFILFIFCFYLPFRLIKRLFGRWFNV